MGGILGTLTFINPWILAGLAFLPALWFLLRVTPPAPKMIRFPATRFLAGLYPDEHTTARTPWWILLLRLLIIALIITALARPLLNAGAQLPGAGGVRLVMDNGWAAAQTWTTQTDTAYKLIDRAGRAKRALYILTTAPEPGKDAPIQHGPLTEGQARTILKGLKPHPWPADYAAAARTATAPESLQSYWLTSGVRDSDDALLTRTLQNQGGLHILYPDPAQLPLLLRPVKTTAPGFAVAVDSLPGAMRGVPLTIELTGRDGRILDVQTATLDPGNAPQTVSFSLPESLRNQIARANLSGRAGAGATLLMDDSAKRRLVGLLGSDGQTDDTTPLIDARYYLQRALEPFADIKTGTVGTLLRDKPAVIILPDVGALPPGDLNALENWVKRGGLLLRFAGPNMTQGDSFLTPVPLMKGGRALDGALTWDKPQTLRPFPESSPYYGLSTAEDITVNSQLLAQPVAGIEKMTWTSLEDGTPLITARETGRGLLVLIHTTATPTWSNLSLSGLFVQILQRTVSLAGSTSATAPTQGSLQPVLVMDGFGNLGQPGGYSEPIPAHEFEATAPSSRHPPGFYGRAGYQQALNLGDRLEALRAFTSPPAGVATSLYDRDEERELMPLLLLAAFILFLIDWGIMIVLQNGLRTQRLLRRARTASTTAAVILMAVLLSCAAFPSPARAETSPQDAVRYAGELHLAYVRTGVSAIDMNAQRGLETLALVLRQRTSVEPAGVIAVDPAVDELGFFPFIYWPVAPNQPPLSPEALRNVQAYLDHGGTILFDTRDNIAQAHSGSTQSESLRTMVGALNIPPLALMPTDHVLTKSFYLMRDFTALFDGSTLWIEENSASGRDGVSSVIIANYDWAAAWAAAEGQAVGGHLGVRRTGTQQEMALRFGINLVLYALTGNYKADQVHLPHILERLGQ